MRQADDRPGGVRALPILGGIGRLIADIGQSPVCALDLRGEHHAATDRNVAAPAKLRLADGEIEERGGSEQAVVQNK